MAARGTLWSMGTQVLKVRVSDELKADLEAEAAELDRPVSWVARQRLEAGRQNHELPPGPIKAISEDSITVQRSPMTNSCPHPEARQRQTVKGKRCLDCGVDL